ncbi:helix-turn-helix domain-containing protein [Acinetobacter pittii]|uniref:helix-turn-helix domain-containing protein n=1 Tax=Acinetobacter pittii TaxID=48296 RepID=UPI002A03F2F3|nr:helix-turn-helix domain-containing protein [Acinetobacter pittii]MDX8237963.1 helix-turn-helix domain-containing protein [Acinetobacter pittii]
MTQISSYIDPMQHANHLSVWQENAYMLLSPNQEFKSKILPLFFDDINIYVEEIQAFRVQQIGSLDKEHFTFIYLESKDSVTINCNDISNDYLYLGCNCLTNSVSNQFVDCLIISLPKEKLFSFLLEPRKELFFYSIDEKFRLNKNEKGIFSSLLHILKKDKKGNVDLEIILETIGNVIEKREIEKRSFLSDSYLFPKICKYILENYHLESLKISDICNKFKISRRTLQYIFENNLGIPPQLYLRYIRLNFAGYFLKCNNNLSIQDVAFNVGMTHFSRFSKYFREFYLVSPSNFRVDYPH